MTNDQAVERARLYLAEAEDLWCRCWPMQAYRAAVRGLALGMDGRPFPDDLVRALRSLAVNCKIDAWQMIQEESLDMCPSYAAFCWSL